MSHTTTTKRTKSAASSGVGHGAKPHTVSPAPLGEFLANYGVTAGHYSRIVRQYIGKRPDMLKRAS